MIIITAPTGQISSQVLDHLLAKGESVRVIVRDPTRLTDSVRERVEVVRGSHGDSDSLDRGFAGADAVFWLLPTNFQADSPEAAYVDFTRPACEAIERHGVKRAVGVSALGRGTPLEAHSGLVAASLAMDDLIASTGVAYRALTMPSFMDNVLWQAPQIRERGMYTSMIPGDLKLPTCATRDIAAVAAELLIDDSWSGNEEVPVLGPEDLSHSDMAEIMSEVLDERVQFQQISVQTYMAVLIDNGYSEGMAQGMAEMMTAKSEGLDNAEQRTPSSATPTTFRQWCEDVLKPAVNNESIQ